MAIYFIYIGLYIVTLSMAMLMLRKIRRECQFCSILDECDLCSFLKIHNFNVSEGSNIEVRLVPERENRRLPRLGKIFKGLFYLLGNGDRAHTVPEAVGKLVKRNYPELLELSTETNSNSRSQV